MVTWKWPHYMPFVEFPGGRNKVSFVHPNLGWKPLHACYHLREKCGSWRKSNQIYKGSLLRQRWVDKLYSAPIAPYTNSDTTMWDIPNVHKMGEMFREIFLRRLTDALNDLYSRSGNNITVTQIRLAILIEDGILAK